MDPLNVTSLTRALIDIDSTTGRETNVANWLAHWLRERGYHVTEQQVDDKRFNIFATLTTPKIVFSTHMDCVPPFFPSREDQGIIYGRGACDAKGIIGSQLLAGEMLRQAGEKRAGFLFVVGEERGSDGARTANTISPGSQYLINGEPTDNRLGIATRGVLRVKLKARGRAAHSSYPELGESAIEKLLDALIALRKVDLPEDPKLGSTSYTVGLISGGVAPNVVPPSAEAEVTFRSVGAVCEITNSLDKLCNSVDIEKILEVPPTKLTTVDGLDTAIFPFTTDIPFLSSWGKPLLFGPGSVLVAHTAEEHIHVTDLCEAIDHYVHLATKLLALP